MSHLLTTGNITFVLGIMCIIFGVYHYFKNPQIEDEKKAGLLAQKVEWEKETTSSRFADMNANLRDATALAQNHIHTVDVKVDKLVEQMSLMRNEVYIRITTSC